MPEMGVASGRVNETSAADLGSLVMSIFLAVVPKRRTEAVASDRKKIINVLSGHDRYFVGARYSHEPIVIEDLNAVGTWVAQWRASSKRDADTFAVNGGRWACSSANRTASRLAKNLGSKAGSLQFDDPVWGSFAAVHGDQGSNRVVAWNTVPAVDPIYFCQDEDYFYISNRPVISKLAQARRGLRSTDLDSSYLLEYLEFGYSFSGVTPYIGVRSLPSRSALSIFGSSYSFIASPSQAFSPLEAKADQRTTGASELAQALVNASERCVARSAYSDLQIRLSGGFDSRLLLGLFKRHNLQNIVCVTHGVRNDSEVAIARELAELAGVEHIVKAPEPVEQLDYFGSLEKSIFDSGGLIPSESLVAPFSPTAPFSQGGAISLGQWPLFKGYLDKNPTSDENAINYLIATRAANILENSHSQYIAASIEHWLSSLGAVSNAEVLYDFARDHRSSRYLEAQTSQIDRDCQVSYPMVDSEVTAVSDLLPLHNRAQNYASFLALQEIWPESLGVPLNTTQTLRFESAGPVEGLSGPLFEERRRSPRTFSGTVQPASYAGTDFESVMHAIEYHAAQYVATHPFWPTLKCMLSDDMVISIANVLDAGPDKARQLFATYAELKTARVMYSRLALACMWVSGAWMR